MKSKLNNKLIDYLIITSVSLVLIGAFMKIFHWTNFGGIITSLGFISTMFIQAYEISRLKKIISNFDKNET